VKEKGLIPADLFDERKLVNLLVGFRPEKSHTEGLGLLQGNPSEPVLRHVEHGDEQARLASQWPEFMLTAYTDTRIFSYVRTKRWGSLRTSRSSTGGCSNAWTK